MNLKDFLARRDGETDLYWALVLEDGWIQAGIWEITEEKAEVISISSPIAWEEDEALVEAADGVLSSAVQSLPEDSGEPSKTVFGVSSSWVSEGQIKKEYLEKIKKLCTELSLEPKGFVVLPEAVAHLVKSEEGSPLNAIVIGVGKENLEVAVFKLGNLSGTTTVARSISVVEDISEGLSRFSLGEPLPSRFIIYDGKEGELDDVKNSIINADWKGYEKISFLHTPKVEILTPERKVLATALAGASEIANVSFVETKEKEETPEGAVEPSLEEVPNPEDLGFVVGEDVGKGEIKSEEKPPVAQPIQPFKVPFSFKPPDILNKTRSFGTSAFSGILGFLGKIRLPQGRENWMTIGGIAGAVIALFIILWVFIPKATVTIFVSPKKLEETTKVNLNDFASQLSTSVSGEKTEATTGTKRVGEKAKGTVKIQNGTANNINLSAGALITTANNLQFTLDSSASVSAAISPSNPGTTDVQVSASDIGAEYNIAKDESLKVGNFPKAEVDAVATADFSGGSSTEISAVSADDQTKLQSDLTEELKDKAREELASNLGNDKLFIDSSVVATPSSKVFSNKVGDQASNLKLSLSLQVKAFVAERSNLVGVAKQVLAGKVPTGYVLREDQLNFNFADGKLTITANLLPELKLDEIAKNLAGKLPSQAEDYLTSIPGFTRAAVTIKPRLPGRFGIIPFFTKNITIQIEKES